MKVEELDALSPDQKQAIGHSENRPVREWNAEVAKDLRGAAAAHRAQELRRRERIALKRGWQPPKRKPSRSYGHGRYRRAEGMHAYRARREQSLEKFEARKGNAYEPSTTPYIVYLATYNGMMKVGIARLDTDRVRTHERRGLSIIGQWETTESSARSTERWVLNQHWPENGIRPGVAPTAVPKGDGYTEYAAFQTFAQVNSTQDAVKARLGYAVA